MGNFSSGAQARLIRIRSELVATPFNNSILRTPRSLRLGAGRQAEWGFRTAECSSAANRKIAGGGE